MKNKAHARYKLANGEVALEQLIIYLILLNRK